MSITDCTTKCYYKHLTFGQRGKIARQVGVHRSTITREIKRGSVKQVKEASGKYVYYDAYFDETAHVLAEKRRKKIYFLKLEQVSKDFLSDFCEAMKAKPRVHSVDTFVHSYKQAHPDQVIPSANTYIHQGLLDVKSIDLPRAVRLKPRNKKRRSTKRHFGISIENRPEAITNRSEFGHWEIDSILGLKTAGEPSILTLVERKTRYAITVYLAGKKAEFVNEAVAELIKQYPIKSITAADLVQATSAINQRPRRLLGYQSAKIVLELDQVA